MTTYLLYYSRGADWMVERLIQNHPPTAKEIDAHKPQWCVVSEIHCQVFRVA